MEQRMKGYAFLDTDHILGYRTQQYIDEDNPFFWQQNHFSLVRKWKFDTEDVESIFRIFRDCKDLAVHGASVRDFCKMIDISPMLVTEYREEQANASKVQSVKN